MRGHYAIIFLLILSCGNPQQASVMRVADTGQMQLPMTLSSFTGKRDGYYANAEMTFVDSSSGEKLLIQFRLEIGVPTKFLRGDYTWGTRSGEVTCPSIDFFGGQGGLPSIGGVFAFTTADGSSYRVKLPTTEMALKK